MMNSMQRMPCSRRYFSALLAIVLVMLGVPAVSMAKEKLPEVDKDGLHLVKGSKVRIAYVRPGATLDKYTKVKLLDCFVEFRKNWERDYNMNEIGLDGRVTDKDAQEIKTRLAKEFNAEFTKVLEKKGYPVVDAVGPDVLLLRPAIINLDVTAPDLMTPDMRTELVQSAGSMTLYMEFYDSATSELIARVVDPREDNGFGVEAANQVTNKAAADRIISRWAELLAGHLGEVATKSRK